MGAVFAPSGSIVRRPRELALRRIRRCVELQVRMKSLKLVLARQPQPCSDACACLVGGGYERMRRLRPAKLQNERTGWPYRGMRRWSGRTGVKEGKLKLKSMLRFNLPLFQFSITAQDQRMHRQSMDSSV